MREALGKAIDKTLCLIGRHPASLYAAEGSDAEWWYVACRVCGKGRPNIGNTQESK